LQQITTFRFKTKSKNPALINLTNTCQKHNMYVSSYITRPSLIFDSNKNVEYECTIEGYDKNDNKIKSFISDLNKTNDIHDIQFKSVNVPYFPTSLDDVEKMGKIVLSGGNQLINEDHPGFNDKQYVSRRNHIAELSKKYSLYDKSIPNVDYTDNEKNTWTLCFDKLIKLYPKIACSD